MSFFCPENAFADNKNTGFFAPTEKPNILFILADDLAYDAVDCTSGDEVITRRTLIHRAFSHVYKDSCPSVSPAER